MFIAVGTTAFLIVNPATSNPETTTAKGEPHVNLVALRGPAHAQWSASITCTAELANNRSGDSSGGTIDWVLQRRGTEQTIAEASGGIAIDVVPGGSRRIVPIVIKLPSAADPLGGADGDFDLVLTFTPTVGDACTFETAHPIHVETRDDRGRINGRYVPRSIDLFGAQSSPAQPGPQWLTEIGIRHHRYDFSWPQVEPQRGQWDQKALDEYARILLEARKYDMTVLPTLGGCPAWAADDGKGGWCPAKDANDWAAFVDKIVGTFSKPPYLQQHWQIWNEAPAEPFWPKDLTIEAYVAKVHKPAARAIASHYVDLDGNGRRERDERCLVVWGGFPCSHWQEGHYLKTLDLSYAGSVTDILDAHYVQGLRWFERGNWSGDVYRRYVVTGRAIGCWQTEMGWGFAVSPAWLPQTFFQDIGWALAHRWNRKDKYRDYFFHYYAAQEGHGFFWDKHKWPSGYAMKTLMEVTRGDLTLPGAKRTITADHGAADYQDVHLTLRPILAGGRLVFLFRPDNADAEGTAAFKIRLRPGETVKSVGRITLIKGLRTEVPFQVGKGLLEFDLPWKVTEPTEERIDGPLSPYCYLVIESEPPMTPWRRKRVEFRRAGYVNGIFGGRR